VAGLATLVGGEVFRAEALLCLFDQARGLGVAVVVLAHFAFGGDVDGVEVRVDGQDIVERDGEEGEVDRHDCCCCLECRVCFLLLLEISRAIGDQSVQCSVIRKVLQFPTMGTGRVLPIYEPPSWLSMAPNGTLGGMMSMMSPLRARRRGLLRLACSEDTPSVTENRVSGRCATAYLTLRLQTFVQYLLW
jgi:hypothetical protein